MIERRTIEVEVAVCDGCGKIIDAGLNDTAVDRTRLVPMHLWPGHPLDKKEFCHACAHAEPWRAFVEAYPLRIAGSVRARPYFGSNGDFDEGRRPFSGLCIPTRPPADGEVWHPDEARWFWTFALIHRRIHRSQRALLLTRRSYHEVPVTEEGATGTAVGSALGRDRIVVVCDESETTPWPTVYELVGSGGALPMPLVAERYGAAAAARMDDGARAIEVDLCVPMDLLR